LADVKRLGFSSDKVDEISHLTGDPSVVCWRCGFQPAAQGIDGETEARVGPITTFNAAGEAKLGKGSGWVGGVGPFPR
jgi:hypothetical protein